MLRDQDASSGPSVYHGRQRHQQGGCAPHDSAGEPNEITCSQDAREGKVSDRFLAPAISRFATSVLADDEQVEDLTQPVNKVRRQLESLHWRWSKITETSGSENVRMKACKEAEKSSKFIRIVQRRDLPWEKDSIARAAYDPEHIPDCNVQATVGKHFLFHEEIPKAANGLGEGVPG